MNALALLAEQTLLFRRRKLRQRKPNGPERPHLQKIAAGDPITRVSRSPISNSQHGPDPLALAWMAVVCEAYHSPEPFFQPILDRSKNQSAP